MPPKTLLQLAGVTPEPADLAHSILIMIDYQNEYCSGPLALTGVEEATEKGAMLLSAAREAGARIIHIAHKGAPGGAFDRGAARGAIIDRVAPQGDEPTVEKTLANAFAKTDLESRIGAGAATLVIVGFMTHNCVSSTARAAFDLGHKITIVSDACATRDLPFEGGVIAADDLHRAELAGLADRHGCVIDTAAFLSHQVALAQRRKSA